MKQYPTNRIKLLFAVSFLLLSITATAQFKKPLSSPRDRVGPSDAKWNVGLVGGVNLTSWLHFHSPETSNWFLQGYNTFDSISPITESMGYFGGIGAERMLKSNLSVGLNVVYAQHNVKLGYVDGHFPYVWDSINNQINYGKVIKNFKANYRTIEAYIPISYYIGLSGTKNVKPYVYVAPRFSLVLPTDNMMYYTSTYTDSLNNPLNPDTYHLQPINDSLPFNRSTYQKLNVGATVGFGSLFRFNTSNYYYLIKVDLSANMNGIQTLRKWEVENDEFKYLRYSADIHATVTFMLPIKKRLVGACVRWGKYD